MQNPHGVPPQDLVDDEGRSFRLADVWAVAMMQRRVIITSLVVCVLLSVVYAMTATRQYRAKAVVHVSTIANQEMEMGQSVTNVNLIWNRDLYLRTLIALVNSRSVRQRILQQYRETYPEDEAVAGKGGAGIVARSTTLTPRKGTELLDVLVTTQDPKRSARLANLTANILRADRAEKHTEAAADAKEWLTERLAEADQQVEDAAAALLEYQELNDMVDAEEGQTTLGAQIDSLNRSYGEVHAARVQFETKVRSHEKLLQQNAYDELAKSMDSELLGDLFQKYKDKTLEVSEMSLVYGEKWPAMQNARKALIEVEEDMRREVERTLAAERAQLQITQATESDLRDAIGGGKRNLLDVHRRTSDYDKRRLEYETSTETYRHMRERLVELDLQAKTQLNNVRVVEEARPPANPATPDVLMVLLAGLVGGLVLGAALAALREFLDDSIATPLDIQTYVRAPLLGTIPKIQDANEEAERTLYTHFNPTSNVAEAVRAMRTSIDLNPSIRPPRRVMVTSALSSEGKTSTAVRLAVSYANVGKRVVIIDCDLRRPRLHKVFGHARTPGFANLLDDFEANADDAIKSTVVPNLSFISAGRSLERPNEALAHVGVGDVWAKLEERFDLIIVDSPPSVIVADARVLSRHVDAVIVMAKQRSTSRTLLREAVRGIQGVGGHVLGVVINEIDPKRSDGYYYYGYGYRYEDTNEPEVGAAK